MPRRPPSGDPGGPDRHDPADSSQPAQPDLLGGLDDEQRTAVTLDAAPLCVLAGAGSGKTRVLTRRIAWRVRAGDAHPGHVLALTFTRKAAGELGDRLRAVGIRDRMAAGTFHGVAYAQLRRRWADVGRTPPALLERKVRLLTRIVPRSERASDLQPADAAAEIEWAKARMLTPDGYAEAAAGAGRRPPCPLDRMAGIYRRYEQEKRRGGLVDFDDLLVECARALEEDPEFTATQRWRFRHLFVDEFQDVNPAQFRLLSGWLGERSDLCVVGDPNQAIYSWNGADPTLLTGFAERFPGAAVVSLDANYRSSPQVLAVAEAVLAGPGDDAGHRVRPTRAEGPVPTVRSYASDLDEARGIARLARTSRRPGTPWSDIAVLTRTNAQLAVVERAFHEARIPVRVKGGSAFLQLPEVRLALRRLSAGRQAMAVWLADLESTAAAGAGAPADGPPEDGSAPEERRLALANLARLGHEYLAIDPTPSGGGFSAWLDSTVGSEGEDVGRDSVELVTFHRAKGLEWPVVFLAGLERGLVPIGRASDPAAEAEERRLLYVAITRAERRLHCSWAERRSFGGRTMARSPSPYLDAVEAACRRLAGGTDGRSAPPSGSTIRAERDRLRAGRRPVTPAERIADGADPTLLAALRQWRSVAARASGVPAYVIFHDSTLAAVAAACPSTPAQLLDLPGLGPVKASRYGESILALVAEHRPDRPTAG